jgi:peptidoglycan-associated lipoprotein
MKKISWPQTLSVLATAALLSACGSSVSLKEPAASSVPIESRSTAGPAGMADAAGGAVAAGVPQSGVTSVDLAADTGTGAAGAAALAALTSQRVVYFDFDSFVVRDEFRPMMEGHAKLLTVNRERKLVIEGHTDERGGREYNLALGQKRAEAVARALEVLGAEGRQIEAVSFGKERPAVQGNDESAYARNRRAELKDR